MARSPAMIPISRARMKVMTSPRQRPNSAAEQGTLVSTIGQPDPINEHVIARQQRAYDPNPLLNLVHRHPRQIQKVASAEVAAQVEAAFVPEEGAGFIDTST